MHKLNDNELRGIVIEETGQGQESSVPGLIVAAINSLKKFARETRGASDKHEIDQSKAIVQMPNLHAVQPRKLGMNLSYTINLNLPAISDISVSKGVKSCK
jgi:hypothetical protein